MEAERTMLEEIGCLSFRTRTNRNIRSPTYWHGEKRLDRILLGVYWDM